MEVNKIYTGDCVQVMRDEIEDSSIDLVVTSPPYNVGIKYDSWDDNMKWVDYIEWCRSWLLEIYRVLKDDGRVAINILFECGNKGRVSPFAEFITLFKDVGIQYNGLATWTDTHRTKFSAWGSWKSASAPYIYNPYECIIIGYKKDKKKSFKGESTISGEDFKLGTSGIWNFRAQTRCKGDTKVNFPTELPLLAIELLTYKNDLVLDPFCGSGTTCAVAKQLSRDYIGIDISESYSELARHWCAESNRGYVLKSRLESVAT
jgi:site-specific DNA-methyltransferase (adenine-specific)